MRMVRAEKGFGIGKRRRVERFRAAVLDWTRTGTGTGLEIGGGTTATRVRFPLLLYLGMHN
jgi:hypothetical protein